MSAKLAHWESEEAMGLMDSSQFPAWHKRVRCSNGIADAAPGVAGHQFKCRNVRKNFLGSGARSYRLTSVAPQHRLLAFIYPFDVR